MVQRSGRAWCLRAMAGVVLVATLLAGCGLTGEPYHPMTADEAVRWAGLAEPGSLQIVGYGLEDERGTNVKLVLRGSKAAIERYLVASQYRGVVQRGVGPDAFPIAGHPFSEMVERRGGEDLLDDREPAIQREVVTGPAADGTHLLHVHAFALD
ncbi:MAG: hypothetical protein R2746_14945 [Acidimicrobiales bacterium]|nr:hypothetical protein [Actinomycetota bacterium]